MSQPFFIEKDHHEIHADTALIDLQANARAGFGLTGVGAVAGATANIVRSDFGPVTAQLGLSATTGTFISPIQFTAQVLGTGVSIGEKTGFSILGSGVMIDVGKTVETIGNKFVHHDVHGHIKPHVEDVKVKVEHVLGIDVVKKVVDSDVIAPVDDCVHKKILSPVDNMITDKIILPAASVTIVRDFKSNNDSEDDLLDKDEAVASKSEDGSKTKDDLENVDSHSADGPVDDDSVSEKN